jgi:hypothetical protein
LTLAGDVNAQLLASVRGSGNAGAPMDAPVDSALAAAPGSTTKSSDVSGVGFAWSGPSIADAKADTALDFVADYLFDSDYGTLARAIQRANPKAFVNGQFITLHNPGVLLLTIAGVDSPAIRQQVRDAIASLQQPMSAHDFQAARNAFEYHIFHDTQTPMERADNFGWYAAEGNADYAPGADSGAYLKAVESLDPGFVAQIVRKYLQHPAIVQLLSGGQKGTSA